MDYGHCPIDQSGVGYFMHFLCVFVVAHTVQMDTLLIGLELSLELFYSPVYWPINNWFSIKFHPIPDKKYSYSSDWVQYLFLINIIPCLITTEGRTIYGTEFR